MGKLLAHACHPAKMSHEIAEYDTFTLRDFFIKQAIIIM